MSTKDMVRCQYNGSPVTFTADGWFNANEIADNFGKSPTEWLRLPTTREYVARLESRYGKIPYVRTTRNRADRGGGTWLHPRLAVRFAQWLDVDFSIWCDEQIEQILSGSHPHHDWKKCRHQASASHKVMAMIVQKNCERAGKQAAPRHFINEALLVNRSLVGEYIGLDRDSLCAGDLDLIAELEILNAVLIANGASRDDRKFELAKLASDYRAARALPVPTKLIGEVQQ